VFPQIEDASLADKAKNAYNGVSRGTRRESSNCAPRLRRGQTMTDTTTQKPLRVSTESTAGPYIMLPLSQIDEVTRLLDDHHIRYWVEENSISLNGGPYISTINLGREGNAQAVQAILDDAR
jgi:hypothetical protein